MKRLMQKTKTCLVFLNDPYPVWGLFKTTDSDPSIYWYDWDLEKVPNPQPRTICLNKLFL